MLLHVSREHQQITYWWIICKKITSRIELWSWVELVDLGDEVARIPFDSHIYWLVLVWFHTISCILYINLMVLWLVITLACLVSPSRMTLVLQFRHLISLKGRMRLFILIRCQPHQVHHHVEWGSEDVQCLCYYKVKSIMLTVEDLWTDILRTRLTVVITQVIFEASLNSVTQSLCWQHIYRQGVKDL